LGVSHGAARAAARRCPSGRCQGWRGGVVLLERVLSGLDLPRGTRPQVDGEGAGAGRAAQPAGCGRLRPGCCAAEPEPRRALLWRRQHVHLRGQPATTARRASEPVAGLGQDVGAPRSAGGHRGGQAPAGPSQFAAGVETPGVAGRCTRAAATRGTGSERTLGRCTGPASTSWRRRRSSRRACTTWSTSTSPRRSTRATWEPWARCGCCGTRRRSAAGARAARALRRRPAVARRCRPARGQSAGRVRAGPADTAGPLRRSMTSSGSQR
jgi:hypothetical protein